MKLILIYGAPAVGKLTVSNEIAKRTDFKVFHNHLSIDCVEPVFEFGTKPFWKLVHLIRIETIKEAARAGRNLIYTFCYAKGADDAHIRKITKAVESNGGEICFVLLVCRTDELEKRVLEESRRKFGKANNLEILREILEKYDLFSPVPERESLIIDNTNLSAEATARKIIGHYKLDAGSRMRYKTEDEILTVVRGFENGTIARAAWRHAEHLTVALYYLRHHDFDSAAGKMRDGIFNLLKAFEVDLKKEMPFHETLTVFWLRTVAGFAKSKNGASFVETCNELIEKFDKNFPLEFYSRELLFSDEARRNFVEPDLKNTEFV